ncbi:hypothetical protein VCUG_01566 [Vavraia culicis subsp. floridensis]|uniref:Uncharacterized protein n=1 Tax=Vavraia culicis (isolate floridensis) TaxID=948595 RepID=L2GUC7_VAVCU|nr:uncharacterized protein VCUG_01566 [Vavraia culicis subsp. floridensis]ELA46947.1 hypothetical protein VCUG_01566 [Vavraia culicis subsp. floridensis]
MKKSAHIYTFYGIAVIVLLLVLYVFVHKRAVYNPVVEMKRSAMLDELEEERKRKEEREKDAEKVKDEKQWKDGDRKDAEKDYNDSTEHRDNMNMGNTDGANRLYDSLYGRPYDMYSSLYGTPQTNASLNDSYPYSSTNALPSSDPYGAGVPPQFNNAYSSPMDPPMDDNSGQMTRESEEMLNSLARDPMFNLTMFMGMLNKIKDENREESTTNSNEDDSKSYVRSRYVPPSLITLPGRYNLGLRRPGESIFGENVGEQLGVPGTNDTERTAGMNNVVGMSVSGGDERSKNNLSPVDPSASGENGKKNDSMGSSYGNSSGTSVSNKDGKDKKKEDEGADPSMLRDAPMTRGKDDKDKKDKEKKKKEGMTPLPFEISELSILGGNRNEDRKKKDNKNAMLSPVSSTPSMPGTNLSNKGDKNASNDNMVSSILRITSTNISDNKKDKDKDDKKKKDKSVLPSPFGVSEMSILGKDDKDKDDKKKKDKSVLPSPFGVSEMSILGKDDKDKDDKKKKDKSVLPSPFGVSEMSILGKDDKDKDDKKKKDKSVLPSPFGVSEMSISESNRRNDKAMDNSKKPMMKDAAKRKDKKRSDNEPMVDKIVRQAIFVAIGSTGGEKGQEMPGSGSGSLSGGDDTKSMPSNNSHNTSMGSMPSTDSRMGSMPSTDNSMGSMPGSDNSMGSMPGTDSRMGSMPSTDNSMGSMPGTDSRMGSMPSTDNSMGSMPGTDSRMGSMPGSDNRMGSMPSTDSRMGSMPSTDSRMGSMPGSDNSMGSMPSTDSRMGSMPSTDSRMGSMPSTDSRMGSMPSTDSRMGSMPGSDSMNRSTSSQNSRDGSSGQDLLNFSILENGRDRPSPSSDKNLLKDTPQEQAHKKKKKEEKKPFLNSYELFSSIDGKNKDDDKERHGNPKSKTGQTDVTGGMSGNAEMLMTDGGIIKPENSTRNNGTEKDTSMRGNESDASYSSGRSGVAKPSAPSKKKDMPSNKDKISANYTESTPIFREPPVYNQGNKKSKPKSKQVVPIIKFKELKDEMDGMDKLIDEVNGIRDMKEKGFDNMGGSIGQTHDSGKSGKNGMEDQRDDRNTMNEKSEVSDLGEKLAFTKVPSTSTPAEAPAMETTPSIVVTPGQPAENQRVTVSTTTMPTSSGRHSHQKLRHRGTKMRKSRKAKKDSKMMDSPVHDEGFFDLFTPGESSGRKNDENDNKDKNERTKRKHHKGKKKHKVMQPQVFSDNDEEEKENDSNGHRDAEPMVVINEFQPSLQSAADTLRTGQEKVKRETKSRNIVEVKDGSDDFGEKMMS